MGRNDPLATISGTAPRGPSMLKIVTAVASLLTLTLVVGICLYLWTLQSRATSIRDQGALNAGLAIVASDKLERVYRELPVTEAFKVKGFWFGDNGKPCGVAALDGGEFVRFIELDDKPTYMLRGRPGWDDAVWLAECNRPTFEFMKLS